MNPRRGRARRALAVAAVSTLLLAGCGGGGGGGGAVGGGSGPKDPADQVAFLGFRFQVGQGPVTFDPPVEDLTTSPPTLGAPLNLTIIFAFDGVPAGPFDEVTLPIFTTPADATEAAAIPPGVNQVLAKGSYAVVGNTVEFRPFIPTQPLEVDVGAPAAAVPGLLPASTYTVRVTPAPGPSISNLVGQGGEVRIETTSSTAAYYPKSAGSGSAPAVVVTDPGDGAADFYPGPLSASPFGGQATYPTGPEDVLVTFDTALAPTVENLRGRDLDGDGAPEPTFFFRCRGTDLLVSHVVPTDALGSHGPFAAVSAHPPGAALDDDGSRVVLHADAAGVLPDPDAGLATAPTSLATGPDADLLWAVFSDPSGPDRLGLVDHVLGDPTHALMDDDSVDTGLDEVVGLTSLVDGRLVAFDRQTRRIWELLPSFVRQRAGHDAELGPPELTGLALGDGVTGFRSEPLAHPELTEVLDLAQAPSGRLYALVRLGADTHPSIVRLAPISAGGNGQFTPEAGLYLGEPGDIELALAADYVDMTFVSERRVLVLNRTDDTIDELDLDFGFVDVALHDVAAYGISLSKLPEGRSPAVAFALGQLDLGAHVSMEANGEAGAVLRVRPAGMLPVDTPLTLMQRQSLTGLDGVSLVNEDPDAPLSPWGSVPLMSARTAKPLVGAVTDLIDDVFVEEFDESFFEGEPLGLPAAWALPTVGGGTTGGLRASTGADDAQSLGDFLPRPNEDFDASVAYVREDDKGSEEDLDLSLANYHIVVLNTDHQEFPLFDGSTPGVTQPTAVEGGRFVFRDFIIPEGVRVVARGQWPLRITATRRLEIHGILDVSGGDGTNDDSFDVGFVAVPGGTAGPGAGRGGDGHPTRVDPRGPQTIDQFVTPETGEHGFGPSFDAKGALVFGPIGGRGGVSTLGYAPGFGPYPDLDQGSNTEHQRPPGGGGGSFYTMGETSREGSGVYLVQSHSTWYPFSLCPTNDKIRDAFYGNEENAARGLTPDTPLQCVYMDGALSQPNRVKPGAEPGRAVFADSDPDNDFIGVGGELPVIHGGQGGGGGGSRVDSMVHFFWSRDSVGSPEFFGPPYYPKIFGPPFYSPTFFDAKGGAGGGGGGAVELRSFSDILISRTGHIDASGGHGGGSERLKNSTASGGGGGGSGGAIVLQAAGSIRIHADEGHVDSAYVDFDGDEGAALDVSGGFGRDAISSPTAQTFLGFGYEFGRSDGGQGGMGLIQLQANDLPEIDRGAYLFAKKRSVLKLGGWTGNFGFQREHPSFFGLGFSTLDMLRYIDMLHYRYFKVGQSFGPKDYYYVLHGSHPPLVPGDPAGDVYGMVNEHPAGSGQVWADTKMMEYPPASGRFVVQEPQPEKVMETYNGWYTEDDPENGEFKYQEINNRIGDPNYDQFPDTPGTTFAGQVIPFSVRLNEPDATGVMSEQESGTPLRIDSNGNGQLDLDDEFDPSNLLDRLPVVHPSRTPPPLSAVSRGTSRWLDFQGVALRTRSASGRKPPFFDFVHGTYNSGWADESPGNTIPAGRSGEVRTAGQVPAAPAHYVDDTGFFPFDPGLFGNGSPPDPPFNDIKVDSPELLVQNAVTDNATVSLVFQGALPVRPGSTVPDPDTLTPWIADLQSLSGYPLVRFQVVFDLSQDEAAFPFGVDSLRPQVDYVRLRARY